MPWRQLGVLALIGALIALATVAYLGSERARRTVTVPPFGPAGNGVIALTKDGDIFVADHPGGDLRPLVAGPANERDPMFSADGTRLVFVRDSGPSTFLVVADADGTDPVQIPLEDSLRTSTWAFAPDGQALMTLAVADGVQRFDPEDQGKRVVIRSVDPAAPLAVLNIRLPGPWMDNESPSFRPTNPREILVFAQPVQDGPRGLYVFDLATGDMRTIVEAPGMAVNNVRWLPDGAHIVYNGRIVAADGSGDRALPWHGVEADQLSAVSNDGTRIVAWDNRYEAAAVVPIDGEGPSVRLACGAGMAIGCPGSWSWSPDDSMLIGPVGDETSRTYVQADPNTGQVVKLEWVDVRTDAWGTPAWQRVAP